MTIAACYSRKHVIAKMARTITLISLYDDALLGATFPGNICHDGQESYTALYNPSILYQNDNGQAADPMVWANWYQLNAFKL